MKKTVLLIMIIGKIIVMKSLLDAFGKINYVQSLWEAV